MGKRKNTVRGSSNSPTTFSASPVAALIVSLLLFSLTIAPSEALNVYEGDVLGQVVKASTVTIEGKVYGLMLGIERGDERIPTRSEMLIVPDANPGNWKKMRLPDTPGIMTTADFNGDGSDDIALVHPQEGPPCAYPQGLTLPCGVIRIYDGPSLIQGIWAAHAEVTITPSTDTCPPSTAIPGALSMMDMDGDGRAELAFSQFGLTETTCGVVHIISGKALRGPVGMEAVCVRVQGTKMLPGRHPENFGLQIQFAKDMAGGRFLAVAAPYATINGLQVAGRVVVYDLAGLCESAEPTLPAQAAPPVRLEYKGDAEGGLLGAGLAVTENRLWIAEKGEIHGLRVPEFTRHQYYAVARTYPITPIMDLDNDGKKELLVGSNAITQTGTLLLNFDLFAAESVRATFLSRDHVLSSDKFGMRVWSLGDVWNPLLKIRADVPEVPSGGTVTVLVHEMISLVPNAGAITWSVLGGQITQLQKDRIEIRAGQAGSVFVTATLQASTASLRIPIVRTADGPVEIAGSGFTEAGRDYEVRLQGPDGVSVLWNAPNANPGSGTDALLVTRYPAAGKYAITAQVTMPDGSQRALTHDVEVVAAWSSISIDAPSHIIQGERLNMTVFSPRSDWAYAWYLSGDQLSGSSLTGAAQSFIATANGDLQISVAARDSSGNLVAAGQSKLTIENAPPAIHVLQAQAFSGEEGLNASVQATDPGGDHLNAEWFVDEERIGEGLAIRHPLGPPGWINVTVVVADTDGAFTTATRRIPVTNPWTTISEARQGDPVIRMWKDNETFYPRADRLPPPAAPYTAPPADLPALDTFVVFAVLGCVVMAWRRRGRPA